jgi:hypothetical protein
VKLMVQTRIYSLAQTDNPPAMKFPNASAVPSDYDFKRDLRYFEALAKFIDHEPVAPEDMAIRGMAASLGIIKGQPFQPDARMKAMLNTAADVAFKMAAVDDYDTRYPNKLIYPDRKWEVAFLGGSPEFRKDGYLNFDAMLSYFHKAFATSAAMVLEMPGKGSQYLVGLRDADGDYLSGSTSYHLHVPANVPAANYWSVVWGNRITVAVRRYNLLHCMSLEVCRFSVAGIAKLSARSCSRRPKSAKARSRAPEYVAHKDWHKARAVRLELLAAVAEEWAI